MPVIKEIGCYYRLVDKVWGAVVVELMNVRQLKKCFFLTVVNNQNKYNKLQYLFAGKQKGKGRMSQKMHFD